MHDPKELLSVLCEGPIGCDDAELHEILVREMKEIDSNINWKSVRERDSNSLLFTFYGDA